MKILIVSIFKLEWFPPILSLIHDLIDLGYDISLITTGISYENRTLLENRKVKIFVLNTKLNSTSQYIKPSFSKKSIFSKIYYNKSISKIKNFFLNKIKSILYFQLIKKFISKMNEISFDYIWFSDIDTANVFRNKLNDKKYVITIQELVDDRKYRKILQNASKLIVPEQTRSFIIRSNYNLKTFPSVLPNKPYDFKIENMDDKKFMLDRMINNRKIILYQGLISEERNLIPFANAIKEIYDKFVFIIQTSAISNDQAQYNYISNIENVFVVPTLPAPKHLLLTKKAYIGLVTYYHKSLNCEFCAPNKIFEYSKFELPILANDVKGLLNTIGKYNAGICLNLDTASTQDIKSAILKIDENYKYYSDNSKKLYESVDRKKILKDVLNRF